MPTAWTATPTSITRRRRPHRREFPDGYSSAGCSPAEPASASPASPVYLRRLFRHNQHRSTCPHFPVSLMGCSSPSWLFLLLSAGKYQSSLHLDGLQKPAIGVAHSEHEAPRLWQFYCCWYGNNRHIGFSRSRRE